MMDIRSVTDEHGEVWLPVKDMIDLLRAMGADYLQHIPSHVQAGEFLECILDRHADFILGVAADWLESGGKSADAG